MFSTRNAMLGGIIIMGLAAAARAAGGPCTIDLTTGTTNGVPDPLGTVDPDWFVNFTPTGGPGSAFSVNPHPAWTNPGGANWIDSYNTDSATANDPLGLYEYQVDFTVDLSTQTNLMLNIDVAADDKVDLFLNGAYIATVNGFAGTTNVTAAGPFVHGLNNVTANVTNGPLTNGPTGLLVLGGVDFSYFPDCNNNCILDTTEGPDCDGNGVLDVCEFVDCNNNGTHDPCDVIAGTSTDCNGNMIPDECESQADCNNNGTPDICEIFADCNLNGIPDECEPDCNDNGTPDACEGLADCNNNGTPDVCEDLADCNNNGTPDVCELIVDCNLNGIPDECEPDCNDNGIPDECESGGPCVPCVLDLSTGTTGEIVDPFGAVDPDWQFIYTPTTGTTNSPAFSIAPATGWVTSGSANWVDPYSTGGSGAGSQDPAGDYGLEINFAVNMQTQTDLVLDIDVATADTSVVMSLNGTVIANVSGSAALTTVTITNPALFLNGANTLRADAIHFGAEQGLLVDGELRWRRKLDVSTGTTAGFPLPAGTVDPDWALNTFPGGGPGPAFTVVPAGAWVTSPGAVWIDPFNTGNTLPDFAGLYEYETLFTIDYACEQDFELDVRIAADNRADLFLNGILVGSTPGFGAMTTVNVTNQLLFVDGVNSLIAIVENDSGPVGLLVDGDVLVSCGFTNCVDCDGNGIHDAIDIVNGTLTDSDNNGIPDECECDADFDGDGMIGVADLLALLAAWGPCPPPCPWDLDNDGSVGVGDLLALLAGWGPC